MLSALMEAVAEAGAWIANFFFGETPQRPRWAKVLVTLFWLALIAACTVATIVVIF